VLLKQGTAQNGFRRQTLPACGLDALPQNILGHQFHHLRMSVQPIRDAFEFLPDLVLDVNIDLNSAKFLERPISCISKRETLYQPESDC